MSLTLANFKQQNTDLLETSHRIVLAYSGGLDSSVLLYLISQLFKSDQLLIWHVNHHLQKDADFMEQFCHAQADQYHIPFKCSRLNLSHLTNNIESQARDARYQVFEQQLKKNNDILLTAHHADDQLETIMLNLSRGSGVLGLRGIARQLDKKELYCLRPLLSFTRSELLHFADEYNIEWIEDSTNIDQAFDRNYIRHEISPKLKERWPSISQSFIQVSEHQIEASECLQELAEIDLKQCSRNNQYSKKPILDVTYLKKINPARLKNLLRYHLSLLGIKSTYHQINQLVTIICFYEREEKKTLINNGFVGLYDQLLYVVLDEDIKSEAEVKGWLNLSQDSYVGRQNRSDRGVSSHFLKRQFQSRRVPPWLREQTLFLLNDGINKDQFEMVVL